MKFTKLSLIILLTATTAAQAGLLSKVLYWGLSIGVPVLKNADDSRKEWGKKPIFDINHRRINWDQIDKKLFNLNQYDQTKLTIGTVAPCVVTGLTRLPFRKAFLTKAINPSGKIYLGIANCCASLFLSQYYDKMPGWYNDVVNHKATKRFCESFKKFSNWIQ